MAAAVRAAGGKGAGLRAALEGKGAAGRGGLMRGRAGGSGCGRVRQRWWRDAACWLREEGREMGVGARAGMGCGEGGRTRGRVGGRGGMQRRALWMYLATVRADFVFRMWCEPRCRR